MQFKLCKVFVYKCWVYLYSLKFYLYIMEANRVHRSVISLLLVIQQLHMTSTGLRGKVYTKGAYTVDYMWQYVLKGHI